MTDRLDRVEDKLREEITKIKEDISDIKISIKAIEIKQNTTFNLGSWVINTFITVFVSVIAIIFGGHIFRK